MVLGPGMTDMGTGDTNTRALQESSTREDFRTTDWFLSTLAFVILSKVEVENDMRTYFSLLLKLKSKEKDVYK